MNCETPDFTDRTNKTMTTHPPLVAHNDEARHEEISSHSQTNFVGRLRQLYVRIQHGAAENRQARMVSFQKQWEILGHRICSKVLQVTATSSMILVIGASTPSVSEAATIYLEPGETKIIPLDPTRKGTLTLGWIRKGVYKDKSFCLNVIAPIGDVGSSRPICPTPKPAGWVTAATPNFSTTDSVVYVQIQHKKVGIRYLHDPLTWEYEFRPSSGKWSQVSGQENQTIPSPPLVQWVNSGGVIGALNNPKGGGGSFTSTIPTHNWSLDNSDMQFPGLTASITASPSAVPGTIYPINAQGAATNTSYYEVWPATTVIISHPCTVGVPAVQNIPFGNVFVSGTTIGTESTTVIQNKISCAGAVANRKYTITSTGTATGATSIPLKEIGGGGTTQGNIYIKTATGGGCSTTGARTMGTAYTLPAKGSNLYSEDLYATLCNVKNGAAGKGSATATITYDWN